MSVPLAKQNDKAQKGPKSLLPPSEATVEAMSPMPAGLRWRGSFSISVPLAGVLEDGNLNIQDVSSIP